MAFKETANERLFLKKDLAAVDEAVGPGAKIYEGQAPSEIYAELSSSSLWMASEVLVYSLLFYTSQSNGGGAPRCEEAGHSI